MLSQVYILQLLLQSRDLLDSLCKKKKVNSKFALFTLSRLLLGKGVVFGFEKCAFDFLCAARHLLLGSLRIQLHISVPFERCLIEIAKQ